MCFSTRENTPPSILCSQDARPVFPAGNVVRQKACVMRIEELIFPVDFTERCAEACPYLAVLTDRLGARLTLLHVLECGTAGGGDGALDRRRAAASDALSAFREQFIPQSDPKCEVLVGDPAQSIVTYAGETRQRMIVMPTHGAGPFRRMLLGSVAAKVLHDARCPVLMGPHLEKAIHPGEWFKLKRVVCAVALDWETSATLRYAAELADQLGAHLVVTVVISTVEDRLLQLLVDQPAPVSTESVEQTLRDMLPRAGVSAHVDVCRGEISRQVAHAARRYEADLIVIGKGGEPEERARLGTHAYAIVRRAPCPVVCA